MDTLKDIEQRAAIVEDQAAELIAIGSNTKASPDSHRERLSESQTLWERQAIAKALPSLADTAANTQKAIEYFSENRLNLWMPDYQGYAERIYRDSAEAAKTLKAYLNFSQTREREERLEDSLGMAGQ